MAAINDLIAQVSDEALRARLEAEVNKMAKQKKFGLVFEEHMPECTPLYGLKIKRGTTVARHSAINEIYVVVAVEDGVAICKKKTSDDVEKIDVTELVPVAEFGEPIYPYLEPLDSICNAPDSDLWHTLIEADNYHALQLLEYLYAGKVDCIYIDPPYNTGAKDWKYNNDYVDGNDSYRHSKWLSFMEKRLKIAKKLLNSAGSVLIVTIDDKEYLHLGCLLEELFPTAKMTMVSSVINPAGKAKKGGIDFSRTDEFIFFLQIGNAPVLPETRDVVETPIAWEALRRHSLANGRGKHGVGACGPNQFYPFYVNIKTKEIVEIGQPIPEDVSRHSVKQIDGCVAVFPVRDNGIEMNWGCVRETALELYKKGYLRVGNYFPDKPQQFGINYLTKGTIKAIENGEVVVTKQDEIGIVDGYFPVGKPKVPTTNWNKPTHNATSHGTDLINKIFCDSRFDYPKSLYAVEDCLKLFLQYKPNALIVDFFSGSGTTMHAVNLLNTEDGGHRRCIMVTNNEVSDAEAKEMSAKGLKPGDDEWNKLGIARYVTWPRTVCSIKGENIKGEPLKGNYIGSDIPMADGFRANAAFFKLGFLDKNAVALGRQFKEMLPTLWMKAGAKGKCPVIDNDIPDMIILPQNGFAVLCDENRFKDFVNKVKNDKNINVVYIITDSEAGYKEMASHFDGKETYQLYRDYLDNFRINIGR